MKFSRRTALKGAAAVGVARSIPAQTATPLYGLIGKIKAITGKRDELAAVLLKVSAGMPGCLSYIIANDAKDPDALWVTEVWHDQAAHAASLTLPAVKEAMSQGRPLIAGFEERHETGPVGGYGLK